MKSFDELFEDFFNWKKSNDDTYKNELKKIIENLTNFKHVDMNDEIIPDLGEPNHVIEFEENGLHFKKLIWDMPTGKLVKIIVSDDQGSFKKPKESIKEETLEEQLKKAIDREDYESAAYLRDKINTKTTTKKKQKTIKEKK